MGARVFFRPVDLPQPVIGFACKMAPNSHVNHLPRAVVPLPHSSLFLEESRSPMLFNISIDVIFKLAQGARLRRREDLHRQKRNRAPVVHIRHQHQAAGRYCRNAYLGVPMSSRGDRFFTRPPRTNMEDCQSEFRSAY